MFFLLGWWSSSERVSAARFFLCFPILNGVSLVLCCTAVAFARLYVDVVGVLCGFSVPLLLSFFIWPSFSMGLCPFRSARRVMAFYLQVVSCSLFGCPLWNALMIE